MALLFADGFEDGSAAWNLTGSSAIGTGRFGSGFTVTAASSYGAVGFVATAGPIIAGFAFKPTTNPGSICGFINGSDEHVSLYRGVGGEITVFRAQSVVLGTSAINVLPSNAWSYVEIKITIHDTTGAVTVRVNGVPAINLTNIDTRTSSATANTIKLGSIGTSHLTVSGYAWDDVYLADSTGSVNNDFLGELTVEHLRPATDDTVQWLGSDGNSIDNYALVDEAGVFNGADYVASSTIGQRDLYTLTPSTRPITSPVAGVVVAAVTMKTDAGTRTIKLDIKEGAGGTVRQSPELGVPTTFGELRAVFDRKDDGTPFVVADVNALRAGIEVVT